MKHGKKILCLLLSILMVFGLLPAAAMAAAGTERRYTGSASGTITWEDGDYITSYDQDKSKYNPQLNLGTGDSKSSTVITVNGTVTVKVNLCVVQNATVTIEGGEAGGTIVFDNTDYSAQTGSAALIVSNLSGINLTLKNITLQYANMSGPNAAMHAPGAGGQITLDNVTFKNMPYQYAINLSNKQDNSTFTLKNKVSFEGASSVADIYLGREFDGFVLDNFSSSSSIRLMVNESNLSQFATNPALLATGAKQSDAACFTFKSYTYSEGSYVNPQDRGVYYAGGKLYVGTTEPTATEWEVSLNAPSGGNIASTSNNFRQLVTKNSAMTDITITPKSGYTFAGVNIDALTNVLSGSGLSASVDNGVLKISGTPTKDVILSSITWPTPVADSKTIDLGTLPEGMELGDGSGDLKQTITSWDKFKTIILKPKEGYILNENALENLSDLLTDLNNPSLGVSLHGEGDGYFTISSPTDPDAPLRDINVNINTAELADAVEAVITDNNGTTTKYAKLANAINGTDGGTVVMKKNPATAVSNATLNNGVTLEDTSGNTYTAKDAAATVSVGTDGKVTLTGGKLDVTPAATKTASVDVTTGTSTKTTVSGSDTFTVTAAKGDAKATVTIPTTGDSVTSGNLTFTAGADGSVFPLDGSDLTGAGSNPGDAVTVPKGTSAEIKVGEVTGAAAAAISVTVPDTNTNGNVTVTKGNGTDAMATVTVAKAGDKFTVGDKTYTAGADNSTFTIGADGKVKLTSGSVKLADGESMTGTFSGKTIENPTNSGSDSVTVEGVPANGGEAAYDKVTVPKGGSGSVYIQYLDTYANKSANKDLVLKVTKDGVSVLEGEITTELEDGRDMAGIASGATIANPDPSGGDTITVTSDKYKDRVTVNDSATNSVTITKAGETVGVTYAVGRSDSKLIIDVTADGASLYTGYVRLDNNEGIGVNGNTITYKGLSTLTIGKTADPGAAEFTLIEGQSFTDKDGNTYKANGGDATFEVDADGTIRLKSGSAEVTPAGNTGASIKVAKKSPASAADDFCPANGGSPFIVTAGKGDGTGTGEGDTNAKATVTILTRGETASSNYLTFTAGQDGSTFPLDGSELTNNGDSITVAGAESRDITVKVGTTTGEHPTNIEVTISGGNLGKTTVTKGTPTIVKIGADGDSFSVNGTKVPEQGYSTKAGEEYAIDMTTGNFAKVTARLYDADGKEINAGSVYNMIGKATDGMTVKMEKPTEGYLQRQLAGGVTLIDTEGNAYKAVGNADIRMLGGKDDVNLDGGTLTVTPATGKTASVAVTKNPSSRNYTTVSGEAPFTVTAGKGDGSGEGAGNDKPTVTIPSTGKTVTVGASADAGMVFTAGTDGSTFPLDGSKLNNTGDSVKFGASRTGTAQVDAGDGNFIGIGNNVAATVKKVPGGHTVTLDDADTSFAHIYPVGEEGSGSISYTAAEDDTTFFVGDDGKTALISGAVKVPANGSTDVRPDGWNSSVSVSVPEDGSDVIVSTVSDTPAKGKAEVANGKSVTIGDKTYKADAANTAFTFDETGKVTLYSGKAELDKGESILGGVSGVEIKNTSADEGKKVTVEKGADQDIVTVPADGKVTIGGVEYTNHSDSDAMTLKVDAEGKVTLTGGAVDLDKDEAVHLNGTAITNNKTGSTLTVSANGTTGTVSAKAGDSFSVGTGTVKDPSADMDFTINSDGTVSANLTNGQSVTINGVKYTGGEGGATLTLDQDGNLSISGNYSANIPGQNTHEINGRVTQDGSGVPGATVTLTQGGKEAVKLATVTTGADGSYKFPAVPAGTYNVVVVSGGKTMTKLVTVADGDVDMGELALPTAGVSSVVDVKPSSPAGAMVGGLDTVASNNAAVGSHVTITLEVDQADADNEGIAALADGKTLMSMDFTVNKKTGGTTTPITNTGMVLEIILTFDTTNKTNITVYRQHGSDPAEALTKLDTRPTDPAEYEDGTYYVGNGFVVVYTEKFSSYAIGYDVVSHSGVPSAPVGSTAFIGGTKNGSISVSPKNARMGETVTITVNPDDGYKLDSLTVTDRNGNPLTLTKISDNQYTYVAPNGRVDVQATFAKADGGYAACDKGASCPMTAYTDVRPTAWYHDGVHYCLDNGLMNGYGNGIWGPSDTTTRAQIVTILWRMNGCPVVDYAMDFEDVASGAWYAEAIRWAASEGIVLGYGDNTFGPNDAVKREQLVTILHRYARFMGYDLSADAEITGAFADADHVSTYAIPAMRWACGCGLVSGVELSGALSLNPLGATSRAEMATLIMRFCAEIVR